MVNSWSIVSFTLKSLKGGPQAAQAAQAPQAGKAQAGDT